MRPTASVEHLLAFEMLPHQHTRFAAHRAEATHVRVEILMVDHVRGEFVLAEEEPAADVATVANLSIVNRRLVPHHRVNAAEYFVA